MSHIRLHLISTGNDLPGYRVVRPLGIARGLTVRSRSIVGTLGASLQTLPSASTCSVA